MTRAMRDGDWTKAQPVKPTMARIDLRKKDVNGFVLTKKITDSEGTEVEAEEMEDDALKIEQMKFNFESDKMECSENL